MIKKTRILLLHISCGETPAIYLFIYLFIFIYNILYKILVFL